MLEPIDSCHTTLELSDGTPLHSAHGALPGANDTHNLDAGQLIRYTLNICRGGHCHPAPPHGTKWVLRGDGRPFENYQPDIHNGHYHDVRTHNVNPMFCSFAKRGTVRVAGCYGGACSMPDTLHIKAPDPHPHPDIDTNKPTAPVIDGVSYLMCGTRELDGVSIEFLANSHDGSAGILGVIQVIKSYRKFTTNDYKIVVKSTGDKFVLDDGQTHSVIYRNRIVPVGTALLTTDSPLQQLSDGYNEIEIAESFWTFLMFQSTKSLSAWVPLQLFRWSWNARSIRLAPNTWAIPSGETISYGVSSPPGTPNWDSNIHDYHWQESGQADEATAHLQGTEVEVKQPDESVSISDSTHMDLAQP